MDSTPSDVVQLRGRVKRTDLCAAGNSVMWSVRAHNKNATDVYKPERAPAQGTALTVGKA